MLKPVLPVGWKHTKNVMPPLNQKVIGYWQKTEPNSIYDHNACICYWTGELWMMYTPKHISITSIAPDCWCYSPEE